ncbi:unnamed protein product [Cyclocybe aegerita]|uniref:Hydrophobin n=1 Tax=Cyclocybe aegerita TaxID=1973307 RepID=A0A8S0WFB7_CYCAE|nr:unnamed protein product [Cyclocybe aegerita]
MFARLSTVFVYVLATMAVLAAATPPPVTSKTTVTSVTTKTTTQTDIKTTTQTNTKTTTLAITTTVPVTTKVPVTTTVTVKPPSPTSTPISQCNTGAIQCCNDIQRANTKIVTGLLGLLGVVINEVTALVGITCSPLSVIGIGGNSCTAQPVCCEHNTFNGIIAIGCTPININL